MITAPSGEMSGRAIVQLPALRQRVGAVAELGGAGQGVRDGRDPVVSRVGHVQRPSRQAHSGRPDDQRIGIGVPSEPGGDDMVGCHLGSVAARNQMRTGALVIDQLNNPGGSAWFMYALASMLSDKPLMTPKQQMMLTSSDIYFALEVVDELEEISTDEEAMQAMGETLGGYPVSFVMIQNFRKFFNFILSEWHEGRMFTQSSYLFGFDYLQPHPKAQYTKPILVLVNSLDFSCGDFFPAIMQDNQRATILGTQTAGAGGYVLGHEFSNIFGVDAFRFTGSIAERINTNPIENLKVPRIFG